MVDLIWASSRCPYPVTLQPIQYFPYNFQRSSLHLSLTAKQALVYNRHLRLYEHRYNGLYSIMRAGGVVR
jgi:hypothetical protein